MEDSKEETRHLLAQYRLHLELSRGFGVEFLPKSHKPAPARRAASATRFGQSPAPSGAQDGVAPAPNAAPHATAVPGKNKPPPQEPRASPPPPEEDYWQPVYAGSSPPDVSYEDSMYESPQPRQRAPEPALPDVPPALPIPADDIFAELRRQVAQCKRCDLCNARSHTVFGEGNPAAELVFVGEGPGADEDRLGRPFVGKAGKLLTKIIHDGMKLHRHNVYICNVVKCRPPENRPPTPSEMSVCRPYLFEQLRAIKPKVVVAMGATAVHGLLGERVPITKFRGTFREWEGTKLMPTFHPAYLLRNYTVEARKMVWDDMIAVVKYLKGEK